MEAKNIFILCMNNSGSTLLQKILATSNVVLQFPEKNGIPTSSEGHNVAANYMPHPREYGVLGIWTERPEIFQNSSLYNWPKIKESWTEEWKRSGSLDGKLLLEKSSPNSIRISLIEENFPESYFISMMRNPYAVCEGIRRRQGYTLGRATNHWGKVARYHMQALEGMKNIIHISYEDLCQNQDQVCEKINYFIPGINLQKFDKKFSGHHSVLGSQPLEVTNLNNLQIKNLSKSDISSINSVLKNYAKEIKYFNYKLITELV